MSEWLKLKAKDGHELSAYSARPEAPARGAVVLVQEIFGVNRHMQGVADSYAQEGYLVIAPALFDRYERDVQLGYDPASMKKAFELYPKLDHAAALLDIAAAFQHATAEAPAGAVVGYCFGGLMAWLSATRGAANGFEPRCTVGYYAGGIGSVAVEVPQCPVMLHFGAEDTHIGKEQVDAVRSAHPEVKVYVYEGAGHAFNRDADPNAFVPHAAKLARERTLAFLREHLG